LEEQDYKFVIFPVDTDQIQHFQTYVSAHFIDQNNINATNQIYDKSQNLVHIDYWLNQNQEDISIGNETFTLKASTLKWTLTMQNFKPLFVDSMWMLSISLKLNDTQTNVFDYSSYTKDIDGDISYFTFTTKNNPTLILTLGILNFVITDQSNKVLIENVSLQQGPQNGQIYVSFLFPSFDETLVFDPSYELFFSTNEPASTVSSEESSNEQRILIIVITVVVGTALIVVILLLIIFTIIGIIRRKRLKQFFNNVKPLENTQ